MKKFIKYIFTFLVLVSFKSIAKAESFYLGDHVPDIYIYMNRINKKVYRQFRMIYNASSNELVYCVEPGATLSNELYEESYNYDSRYNISEEKWDKLKKIAYFGYRYGNHQDIKWYAITQYIIWKEVMPSNWELYFVDKNHNRLDDLFINEINEIYYLVNNYPVSPNIYNSYKYNYNDDIKIIDTNNLISNYSISNGNINNNVIDLNNLLNIGNNTINLNLNNYKKTMYYYHPTGQNILDRGDIFLDKFSFNVYITAGKLNINECNSLEEYEFIGGTYEVLDQDGEVVEEIECTSDKKCTSNNLPIGNLSIRVKELSEEYEDNDHIYDVIVNDGEITDVNICSYKKKIEKNIVTEEKEDEIEEEIISTVKDNTNQVEEGYKVIDVPYTYKSSFIKYLVFIPIFIIFIGYLRHDRRSN